MDEAVVALDTEAMIWSAPLHARSARPLLVMMHGRGGVEEDLADCFPMLPAELLAVSLRGPVRLADRWAWFDHERQSRGAFDEAARGVLARIATLPHEPIGLLGFSQGGAMAIQLMRLAPRRFGCAAVLSAFVMPGRVATDVELADVRPPVFCGHGGMDDVIPPADPFRRLEWLRRHTTLTERTYPDLGHSLTDVVLDDAIDFIRAHLLRV